MSAKLDKLLLALHLRFFYFFFISILGSAHTHLIRICVKFSSPIVQMIVEYSFPIKTFGSILLCFHLFSPEANTILYKGFSACIEQNTNKSTISV